ncbi:MAG: hypothetical protein ABI857_04660 [Acidobacteriota bacterium]
MNPRRQIFGPMLTVVGEGEEFRLLPATLATNLLLYDKFVINSIRLREIPLMVAQFGLEDTIALLNSGAIEIHSEATQIVNMDSTEEAVKNGRLYQLALQVIVDHDHRDSVRKSTDEIMRQLKLPINDFIRLRAAIVTHLDSGIRDNRLDRPEFRAARGLAGALEVNTPTLKFAVAQQLRSKGIAVPTNNAYKLLMHRHEGDRFSVETNLADIAKCDDASAHDAIQQAVLSLGGLRSQLEYMAHYEAIGTIGEADVPLLSDELQLFANRLTGQGEAEQLVRIAEIAGFPDLSRLAKERQLRLDKILELRETQEIVEFRSWLPTVANVSENELRARIESFSNRVASVLRSKHGKGLRWLMTKGLGMAEPVSGTIVSLANTFLLEKLLPVSGPVSFVNEKLSGVFKLETPAKRAGLTTLDLSE